jgi:type IV fimbrial biogenesis protein FimT
MNGNRTIYSYRVAGFSLIELMVTIGVAAILLAIALPNLRTFMRRNAVVSETNDLIGDLQYARSTAVNQRALVAVCPRTTSTTSVACDTGNSFENGWIIYVPTTAGAVYAGNGTATDTTLLRTAQPANSMSIRGLTTMPVVTFNQRGELTAGTDMKFSVCSKKSSTATVGESISGVTGVTVTQASSGRVASTGIAVGGSCSPG